MFLNLVLLQLLFKLVILECNFVIIGFEKFVLRLQAD